MPANSTIDLARSRYYVRHRFLSCVRYTPPHLANTRTGKHRIMAVLDTTGVDYWVLFLHSEASLYPQMIEAKYGASMIYVHLGGRDYRDVRAYSLEMSKVSLLDKEEARLEQKWRFEG